MDLFQQFLNRATQDYKQADKALGGWLPGGGTPAPPVRAFVPAVRAFAKSPVYTTARDKAFVPILDKAMEQGIVPAKEGMFARFLSGTSVPLTTVPADTRQAEALINNRLSKPTKRDNQMRELHNAMQTWQSVATPINSQREMYAMHGIGTPVTKEQEQKATFLKQNVDALARKYGLSNFLDYYNIDNSFAAQRQATYNPSNYTMSNYSTLGPTGLGFTPEQTDLVNKGLVNTLGRYQVEKGKTKNERYDFNSYNVGTPLFVPGSMVGGVVGEPESSRELADKALGLADKLGFISPGAGYNVEFNFRNSR